MVTFLRSAGWLYLSPSQAIHVEELLSLVMDFLISTCFCPDLLGHSSTALNFSANSEVQILENCS
eukprot:3035073-Amphidinium_carterae.1